MMHYKFLISPWLPLRQFIPLHINTYCDSDWATDIESRKSTSGIVTTVLQVPLTFNSRTHSTVATSSAEAELYTIGLGISDSLHIYQLLQELQHHHQRPTFDFGNLDTQYNLTTSTAAATKHWHLRHHWFTSLPTISLASTSAPSISLCATFVQDIQATGLVNIRGVTLHNNLPTSTPSVSHLQCCNGIFVTTESLSCTSKRGRSSTSTSSSSLRSTSMIRKMTSETPKSNDNMSNAKFKQQFRQLFNKKKEKQEQYIENRRRGAAQQQPDIEHEQSQVLLQQQALSHQAPQVQKSPITLKTMKDKKEEQPDITMKEYKEDLREDYIPFSSVIDFDNDYQLPELRLELQPETTLPRNALRTTADIMADILLRKQQGQIQDRTSSPHLEGTEGEGEETLTRRVRTSSLTAAASQPSLQQHYKSNRSLLTRCFRRTA